MIAAPTLTSPVKYRALHLYTPLSVSAKHIILSTNKYSWNSLGLGEGRGSRQLRAEMNPVKLTLARGERGGALPAGRLRPGPRRGRSGRGAPGRAERITWFAESFSQQHSVRSEAGKQQQPEQDASD